MAASVVTRGALLRAAATSGSMMALGDVLTQTIQRRRHQQQQQQRLAGGKKGGGDAATTAPLPPLDFSRTFRFALIGATLHGPFFCAGLAWLDRLFPGAPTPALVAKKVLTGQLVLFPTYTATFLAYLRVLEGTPVAALPERLASERGSLAQTITRGSIFWPCVNVVNFSVVPPGLRIFAMNCAGLAWNAYLSYATQEQQAAVAGAGAGAGTAALATTKRR
jgi:hypothetical protein